MLRDGTAVMNSADAATGLVALKQQAPDRSLELAGAVQRAWYVDGHSLSDVEVYRSVANDHGLDAEEVAAAYADSATAAQARAEFRTLRTLGVDSYPTLLLHTDSGVHRLGGPVSNAATLTQALDRHLTTV